MLPLPFGKGQRPFLETHQAIDAVLSGKVQLDFETMAMAGERLSQAICVAPEHLLNPHLHVALGHLANKGRDLFSLVLDHLFSTKEGLRQQFESADELQKDFFRLMAINEVYSLLDVQEALIAKVNLPSLPVGASPETYAHAFSALLKFFADQIKGEFLGRPKDSLDWLYLGSREKKNTDGISVLEAERLLRSYREWQEYADTRRKIYHQAARHWGVLSSVAAAGLFFFGPGLASIFSWSFLGSMGAFAAVCFAFGLTKHVQLATATPAKDRENPFKRLPQNLSPKLIERVEVIGRSMDDLEMCRRTLRIWKTRLESKTNRLFHGTRHLSIVHGEDCVTLTIEKRESEILDQNRPSFSRSFSREGFARMVEENTRLLLLSEKILADLRVYLNKLMVVTKGTTPLDELEPLLAYGGDVEGILAIQQHLLIGKRLPLTHFNKAAREETVRFIEHIAQKADLRSDRKPL